MIEIPNSRPKIISLTSSVGVEKITFIKDGLVLNDKVEKYLMDVLVLVTDTMKRKALDFMKSIKELKRLDWIDQNYA